MRRLVRAVVIGVLVAVMLWFGWRGIVREQGGPTALPSASRTSAVKPAPSRATPVPSAKPTTAKPSPGKTTAAPTKTPTAAKPTTAKPKPTTKPKPASTKVPARPKNAQKMTVTYVYDGDTIQLKSAKKGAFVTTLNPIKVRLIGVNTPEMTPKKECYAQQATTYLTKLLPKNSTVWIAPDKDSWDDYKRRLFHVWTDDGTFVDLEIIKAGNGRALRIWPNVTHYDLFKAAEVKAQKAKKGLWGRC